MVRYDLNTRYLLLLKCLLVNTIAAKDSRCTLSTILNLTASKVWVPVLGRKNNSAAILHTFARTKFKNSRCHVRKFSRYYITLPTDTPVKLVKPIS